MNFIKKPNPWLMIAIAAMFYSYEFFLRVSPSIMTKNLMVDFHISARQVGLLSSYYFWSYTPMQLFIGVIMDHYKIRILIISAIAACTIGAWLFFSQNSLFITGFGRLVIGFGSAFAFVAVLKITAEWLPNKYFSIISGVTTSLGMLGAISGEYLLSNTIDSIGYDNTINLILYFGIFLIVLASIFIKDHHKLKDSNKISEQLGSLYNSLLTVAKNKQIWINAIISAALYMPTTFFAGQWAISYFIDVHHVTTSQAAFASSILFIGWIIGAPLMGWLSNKVGRRNPFLFTCTSATIIASILLLYIPTNYAVNLVLMFIIGFFSSGQILVFAIAHEISASTLVATAIAFINMATMFGGFVQQFVGVILDSNNAGNTIAFNEYSYKIALSTMPICFFIGLIFCFFLKETYCKMQVK